jgi:hypothetical protein
MGNYLAISWREQVTFCWDGDARFVLDQHAELDLYSGSSLNQQSVDSHLAPLTRTQYSDSEPSSLCSYSLSATCSSEKQ